MYIENEKVILRNMIIADIDDVIYWNTVDTEWMKWDAPWVRNVEEDYDWDAYRNRKIEEITNCEDSQKLQSRLEVCINNEEQTHIGAVSCYFINDEFKIDDDGNKIAIGMDVYSEKYRGNGYGSAAYALYMKYLKSLGYDTVYTQTWSGNLSLIKMANKLGFKQCNRYVGIRNVRGKTYDGLTFILKL